MKHLFHLVAGSVAICSASAAAAVDLPRKARECLPPLNPDTSCGDGPCVVNITKSDKEARDALREAVGRPNTTVYLGPDVDLNFDGEPQIDFRKCVTLTSVNTFRIRPEIPAAIPRR